MSSVSTDFFIQPNAKEHHSFPIQGRELIAVIKLARVPEKLDLEASTSVLVNSFISEYRDKRHLAPSQIKSGLSTWDEVKEFYENYFKTEREKFRHGEIQFWVEAFVGSKLVDRKLVDGKLAGWATFRVEALDENAVYMELLAVEPNYQRMGIGKQLVYSLIHLNEIPDLHTINLDLRVLNEGGKEFYTKLGFHLNPEYKGAPNEVDRNLLQVYTWRKPALQNKAHPEPEPDTKSGVSSLGM